MWISAHLAKTNGADKKPQDKSSEFARILIVFLFFNGILHWNIEVLSVAWMSGLSASVIMKE